MKRAVIYLLFLLLLYASLGCFILYNRVVILSVSLRLGIFCGLFGGVGGVTYCLRGIYLNACVFNNWSENWLPWYFIRPHVSTICGVASCLFLKAGLLALEAQQTSSPTNIAFYALAFAAGLNVDRFMEKIEDIAEVTWGIKKSRTSTKENEKADK